MIVNRVKNHMAKKAAKGEPKKVFVSVKLEQGLVRKAGIIAASKNITAAEYLSQLLVGTAIEGDFAEALRQLETLKSTATHARK